MGLDRATYTESVRVIPVPTTALLGLGHILDAFDAGADGIIAIEGNHDVDEDFTRERMDEFRDELEDIGVDGMRLYYSLVQLPAYKNIARLFEIHASTVEDLGPMEPEELEAVKDRLGF